MTTLPSFLAASGFTGCAQAIGAVTKNATTAHEASTDLRSTRVVLPTINRPPRRFVKPIENTGATSSASPAQFSNHPDHLFPRLLSSHGKQNRQVEPAFNEGFQLTAAFAGRSSHGVGMDDIVTDELLGRFPIALSHRCGQRFLVYFATTQADILGMMRIAEDICQKHLVGFDSFPRILGNRRGDEARHVSIR